MGKRLIKIIYAVAATCVITIAIVFVIAPAKTDLSGNVKPPLKQVKVVSPYRSYGFNIDAGLSKYKNTLKNAGSQKIKIYCIGESSTRGEFSSDEVNNSWVGVMKSSMQKQYGNAGEGFISIYEGALLPGTKPRWTLGEGWSVSGASKYTTSNIGGLGGCFGTSDRNTSPTTLTFKGTDLDLIYAKSIGGGIATVKIDGAEVGIIDCLDNQLSFSHKVSYTGLSNTTHTLVIVPNTTSNIFIEGAIASSNTIGIEVDKIAISSKSASYFNTISTSKTWDSMPAPDLVLLSFGTNEAGHHVSIPDYKASMVSLVKYWKGRGSSVCLVLGQEPAASWTTNWPAYVASVYEISSTYNTGIIDIYKAFYKDYGVAQKLGLFGLKINDFSGNSGTNAAHPGDKGYKYIGDVLYNNLN